MFTRVMPGVILAVGMSSCAINAMQNFPEGYEKAMERVLAAHNYGPVMLGGLVVAGGGLAYRYRRPIVDKYHELLNPPPGAPMKASQGQEPALDQKAPGELSKAAGQPSGSDSASAQSPAEQEKLKSEVPQSPGFIQRAASYVGDKVTKVYRRGRPVELHQPTSAQEQVGPQDMKPGSEGSPAVSQAIVPKTPPAQ